MNDNSHGVLFLTSLLPTLPEAPGVYQMLGSSGQFLYIGKAKNLRKRVSQYTQLPRLTVRLQRMVSQIHKLDFIVTNNEIEALILESNLIKKLKPPYNILLRDDKMFPYIQVTTNHPYPKLIKYRGKAIKADPTKSNYFGPFTDVAAMYKTLEILHRAFKLRSCSDYVFANRKRPCLQYYIKRCSAPCVGKASVAEYADSVAQACLVLGGKNSQIQKEIQDKMVEASNNMEYEKAAAYRDQLKGLSFVKLEQNVNLDYDSEYDVIAVYQNNGISCVQVLFYRHGAMYGQYHSFPQHNIDATKSEVLEAFIKLFYLDHPIAKHLIISDLLPEQELIAATLTEQAQTKITIHCPKGGFKKTLIDDATNNAQQHLQRYFAERLISKNTLNNLAQLFKVQGNIARIEVYDNSHLHGTNPYGAMIVVTEEGFQKKHYRLFKMDNVPMSDDYAMMRSIMQRRFKKYFQEYLEEALDSPLEEDFPQLMIVDGGKGQLSAVMEIIKDLRVIKPPRVIAMAKGPDRNAGREVFFTDYGQEISLPHHDQDLHYLQRIRDEAHRFAISTQRKSRKKSLIASSLDHIPGIGAKRKQELLKHFGSLYNLEQARISEIAKVKGIDSGLAQIIHDSLRPK